MPSDLRKQLGQLLIMGFDGTEMSNALRALLRAMQPGGVILFKRNVVSAKQTWDLLRECQTTVPTPMFRCVDMEGGIVDRLKDAIVPAPAAAPVFASQQKKLFREHGRLIENIILIACIVLLPVFIIQFIAAPDFFNRITVRGYPLIVQKGDLTATYLAFASFYFFLQPARGLWRWFLRTLALFRGKLVQRNPQRGNGRSMVDDGETEPHEEVRSIFEHRQKVDTPILNVRRQHRP